MLKTIKLEKLQKKETLTYMQLELQKERCGNFSIGITLGGMFFDCLIGTSLAKFE